MPKKKPRPLSVGVYNEFVDCFHKESDRAAAVLAGGYLDSFLDEALRDILAPGPRVNVLFEGQGALRSLGNKIALAYATGLVTDSVACDMDMIRKIRNHFAHHIWDTDFGKPPITDWCKQIKVTDTATDPTTGKGIKDIHPPRLVYLLAVGISTLTIATSPKVSAQFRERMTGIPSAKIKSMLRRAPKRRRKGSEGGPPTGTSPSS